MNRSSKVAAAWLALLGACGDDPSRDEPLDGGREPSLRSDASHEDMSLDAAPDQAPVERDAQEPAVPPSPDAGLPDVAVDGDAASTDDASTPRDLPYARHVTRFMPGSHAGFGADKLPSVVLGPPRGAGTNAGSLDVLSLGVGGQIVLDFGEGGIVDGPGPDFVVFENAFWPGGDKTRVFAELAEVSVSADDVSYAAFPCDAQGIGMGAFPGCAGWTPTLAFDAQQLLSLEPALTGGDAFDLAVLSVANARYVRIRDLSSSGEGNTAGFDLDAVGVIHTGR